MPGLLQSAQPMPQQAPQMAPQAPQQQPQPVNHDEIMGRVNKMVMAAQQIMYNPKTSKMFMQQLQRAGKTPEERAGKSAAGMIGVLAQEAKGQIDPRTIVPAGVIICADLMDFMGQTEGLKFGEEENNAAVKIFVEQITNGIDQPQAEQAEQVMPEAQPMPQEQPMQQPMQGAM